MEATKTWQQYEQGIDYKTRIGLYNLVNVNERFFHGDQWFGIPHDGLPTPVLNFIERVVGWKSAAVSDRRTSMMFFNEGKTDKDAKTYVDQLSGYTSTLWERLKMDYLTKEGLIDAAVTGDFILFFYWDSTIQTGQALEGDINVAMIDNVNYYPGDPNQADPQKQPYIIIAFRDHIETLRKEAEANGVSKLDLIKGDEDNDHTAGDRGKIELDDNTKITVLLKLWKGNGYEVRSENGTARFKNKKEAKKYIEETQLQKYTMKKCTVVYSEKATRNVTIWKDRDTKLTRYPVAMMNWKPRKNCCHGTADVTSIIPNQVYVNKQLALAQIHALNMGFPKVLYDETRVPEYTNQVGASIPVSGPTNDAIKVVQPGTASFDTSRWLDTTMKQTMDMLGANDIVLGNVNNPDNTSAFIATRDAAMVPLQLQQQRFYAMLEDVGLIWLDFIQGFYKNGREIPIKTPEMETDNTGSIVKDEKGKPKLTGKEVTEYVPIDEEKLKALTMKIKIEVGPSTMWSEIQTIQTLDNLLAAGHLTLKQYLQRMPSGLIPDSDKLAEENDQMMQLQAQLQEATKILELVPPEVKQQINVQLQAANMA